MTSGSGSLASWPARAPGWAPYRRWPRWRGFPAGLHRRLAFARCPGRHAGNGRPRRMRSPLPASARARASSGSRVSRRGRSSCLKAQIWLRLRLCPRPGHDATVGRWPSYVASAGGQTRTVRNSARTRPVVRTWTGRPSPRRHPRRHRSRHPRPRRRGHPHRRVWNARRSSTPPPRSTWPIRPLPSSRVGASRWPLPSTMEAVRSSSS